MIHRTRFATTETTVRPTGRPPAPRRRRRSPPNDACRHERPHAFATSTIGNTAAMGALRRTRSPPALAIPLADRIIHAAQFTRSVTSKAKGNWLRPPDSTPGQGTALGRAPARQADGLSSLGVERAGGRRESRRGEGGRHRRRQGRERRFFYGAQPNRSAPGCPAPSGSKNRFSRASAPVVLTSSGRASARSTSPSRGRRSPSRCRTPRYDRHRRK